MTTLPTNESVLELLDAEITGSADSPCISLCMSTHKTGKEIRGDRIQLKNLLGEALSKLKETGMAEGTASRLLEPIEHKLHDEDFWQHRTEGLAIYLCGEFFRIVDLDHPVEPLVNVGNSFMIRPVAVQPRHRIDAALLTLTMDEANLYRVSADAVEPWDTDEFPVTREELAGEREPEADLQFLAYASQSGRGDRNEVMFHGHGEGESKLDADRQMYLARIGQRLTEDVKVDVGKLILFTTDEVAGHFHAATGIEPAATVHASSARMSVAEIATKVRPVAQSLAEIDTQSLREQYGTRKSQGHVAEGFEAVFDALEQHRVETLFVRSDARVWGHRRESNGGLSISRQREDGDSELNDMAISQTLKTGGEVIHGDNVLSEDVPIAAWLRF